MIEITIWLFILHCTANCTGSKEQKNNYFNANSFEDCVKEANNLIRLQGLTGQWEIECKPYNRKVIVKSLIGN